MQSRQMALFYYATTDNIIDSLPDYSLQNDNRKTWFFATDNQFSKTNYFNTLHCSAGNCYRELKYITFVRVASLISTMALNDNKAGMQGLDKERINQIIYEASKGQ